MPEDRLITSLRQAVEAAPDDVELRLHLAQLLVTAGERDEAVRHAAAVLQRDPTDTRALAFIAPPQPAAAPVSDDDLLHRLDDELRDLAPPMFVGDDGPSDAPAAPYELETVRLRLADVGGLDEVKRRLDAAVLAPLRNPELGRLYRKSLRGGLLLYGPPGCGKTYVARALAGELGAKFMPITLADVLDMYIGSSEKNIHEVFEYARRNAPCVLFFDEVDAIGQKRSQRGSSGTRGSVNQLLVEMDGVAAANDGVFVLGATNHPWDVDVALRRPGRFDRQVFVTPPDPDARQAILRHHLTGRPVENIDLKSLAKQTDGFSGADLAYLCESAAERALVDSAARGQVRMIGMPDLSAALADVRPSMGAWFDAARNVAQFANEGGVYDELLAYLKRRKML